MELNREQVIKDLQEIVDNYSGSWQRFNVLDNALALIKELAEENERLKDFASSKCEDCAGCTQWNCDCANIEAYAIHRMQTMIKEECIAGGIYPAFVARVVENVGKRILEGNVDDEMEDRWIITENGCVITCPKCGERLELCYPDGTEVRYLPHCPWCGKRLSKGE